MPVTQRLCQIADVPLRQDLVEIHTMDTEHSSTNGESGKAGWLLLWLLGIPIPILLILFLVRGCT